LTQKGVDHPEHLRPHAARFGVHLDDLTPVGLDVHRVSAFAFTLLALERVQ